MHEVEGDKRTVAHLLVDQLEFANLLLVNKRDLVTAEQLGAVEAFLRKVNPKAEVRVSEHSALPPAALLATARFSMQKAEAHPQWLKEASAHEHRYTARLTLALTLKLTLTLSPTRSRRASMSIPPRRSSARSPPKP